MGIMVGMDTMMKKEEREMVGGEKAITLSGAVGATSVVAIRFASLLLLFLSSFLLLSPVSGNTVEGDALDALRKNVTDPDNVLVSWDTSIANYPCTWFHVTCDSASNVARVDLGGQHLSGNLVPELAKLTNIQYLNLYRNKLSGKIPPELGDLVKKNPNLVSLDFSNNCLDLTDNPFDPSNTKVHLGGNDPANCA